MRKVPQSRDFLTIGAPGFEPGTSPTRTVRATRLRHAPNELIVPQRVAPSGTPGKARRTPPFWSARGTSRRALSDGAAWWRQAPREPTRAAAEHLAAAAVRAGAGAAAAVAWAG